MKNFITKIANNQSVSLEELNVFVVDYCKLMDKKIPTQEELSMIVQAIQMRIYDLIYMVKNAAIKLNIQLNLLYDKHGQLIRMFIP